MFILLIFVSYLINFKFSIGEKHWEEYYLMCKETEIFSFNIHEDLIRVAFLDDRLVQKFESLDFTYRFFHY